MIKFTDAEPAKAKDAPAKPAVKAEARPAMAPAGAAAEGAPSQPRASARRANQPDARVRADPANAGERRGARRRPAVAKAVRFT